MSPRGGTARARYIYSLELRRANRFGGLEGPERETIPPILCPLGLGGIGVTPPLAVREIPYAKFSATLYYLYGTRVSGRFL